LQNGANHNLIGGTLGGGRNLISGNVGSGVLLDGGQTTLNQVSGNYIGLNLAGDAAIPNQFAGVRFDNGAHHNLLGSLSLATERNVISGNAGDGVRITVNAHHNYVDGNFIGLDASGLAVLGNAQSGVAITNAYANSIGSAGATTAQFIGGNAYEGVHLESANNNTIGDANWIGFASDAATPAGNGGHGVWVSAGDSNVVTPHAIAYNLGAGVAVTNDLSLFNVIYFGTNHDNGGLPIDLNVDGVTLNDPDDADSGPNTLLNYPLITALAGNTVTGTACANCTVVVYEAIGNPGGPGGGGQMLGQTVANAGGVWSLSGLPAGLTQFDLTATACYGGFGGCSVSGNTSEMSPLWQLNLPIVLRN
jgi:hypothetical protein